MTNYKVIGLMSGTSLDGVDIAFCRFRLKSGVWSYRIMEAETIPYSLSWKKRLAGLEKGSALELALTDTEYGHCLGKLAGKFIEKHRIGPDFIASHGHTIFHQPDKRLTLQIGRGAAIAAESGYPVVSDFRSLDVALGGQGAPLVPIGDRLLFPGFEACLNLGGFGNVSFEKRGKRIAFDICPVNIVLNDLASLLGKSFDRDGKIARSGRVDDLLLKRLNSLPFYKKSPPKSLGREWVIQNIHPLLKGSGADPSGLLATFTEHIAMQVARAVSNVKSGTMLATGGGAMNLFLMERIRYHCECKILVPEYFTVNFKEALIFAFLGVLRWSGSNNCLASVTGARNDNPGGSVSLPADKE